MNRGLTRAVPLIAVVVNGIEFDAKSPPSQEWVTTVFAKTPLPYPEFGVRCE